VESVVFMLRIGDMRNCPSFDWQHAARMEYGSGIDAGQVSAARDVRRTNVRVRRAGRPAGGRASAGSAGLPRA